MQSIGLEAPSQSLRLAHIVLALGLTAVAVARPRPWLRRLAFTTGVALVVFLPILWVGPFWSDGPGLFTFIRGFYFRLLLSLAIPFVAAAVAVVLLARHRSPPELLIRITLPLTTYIAGLIASFPVSFNYALLYSFIR